MTLRESGEMYLETIYVLSQKSTAVRSIDVGAQMGFSKPSVSRAIGILKKDGLVAMDGQGFLKLTEEGEKRAKAARKRRTGGRMRWSVFMVAGCFGFTGSGLRREIPGLGRGKRRTRTKRDGWGRRCRDRRGRRDRSWSWKVRR